MTFSIVAIDTSTGELGVGVQTHQPSVGAVVPWVRPGVGAVATQSMTNVNLGPQILGLLEAGLDPTRALRAALAADDSPEIRQVAVVDRQAKVAVHTGADCIPYAGHIEGPGFSMQANMMLRETVPQAMRAAYETSVGHLATRIMVALEAAQAKGGDIRGSQSATIIVMRPGSAADSFLWDLRVDNDPEPLVKLHELIRVRQAGAIMRRAPGSAEEARAAYADACRLAPSDEQTFWYAVRTLGNRLGQIDEAAALLQPIFERAPQWLELLHRLKGPNRCAPLEERFPRR